MSYQYKDRMVVEESAQDPEEIIRENWRNIKRRLTRGDRDRLIMSDHVSNSIKLLAM